LGLSDGHLQIGLGRGLFVIAVLAIVLVVSRRIVAHVVVGLYRRNIGVKNTLVVGPDEEAWQLVERFRASHQDDSRIVGHIWGDARQDPTAMGGFDDLVRILEEHDIQNVVVSSRVEPGPFRDLVAECFAHGAAVSVVPATLASFRARVSSRNLLGLPLLEIEVPRLHLVQVVLKRLVDLTVSSIGLLVLSPLLLLVAVAVWVESPGPILFRQKRLGVGGRKFTIYKFRSMRRDAEEILRRDPALQRRYVENNYKLPPGEDPRISPLGRFLRGASLDELPQLFNVLRGDMSLVGPRPIVPSELQEYGTEALTFLGVKPGITGHWQINGRSDVGYPERADLDLAYINRWSLLMDLKILILTIPRLFNGAH
jgi:exopolysaccharide production protein ExoY